MGLNIKNERVHELAREAARVTGTTQTAAIEQALEMLLREHGADPAAKRVRVKIDTAQRIVDAYAAAGASDREIARVEDLYDEARGLPT